MDWDLLANQMFHNCVEAIKICDPLKRRREWQLYWQLMYDWKHFKEEKAAIEYGNNKND
jgi:hypothetical protein